MGYGAFVLCPNREVAEANDQARFYFAQRSDMVRGVDRSEGFTLEAPLFAGMKVCEVHSDGSPAVALELRPDGLPVLFQTISLVPDRMLVLFRDANSDDRSSKHPLPLELLQAAFGLTFAEARLAAEIADGSNLHSIAKRLQLTIGTLRVQLKSVFVKTRTNRQAELAALLRNFYRY